MSSVSFVVPVYNTPLDELQRCIASIMDAGCPACEIIVVDDGSKMELSNAYREYTVSLHTTAVRYIHQANRGVSAARNAGISMAENDYIMFVDSDDILLPGAFGDSYNADFVMFCHYFIKGRGNKIFRSAITGESREISHQEHAWTVLQGKLRGACGHLYSRQFLLRNQIWFEEGCIQGEDADFNFLFMTMQPTVQFIKKPVYQYLFTSKTELNRWKRLPKEILMSEAKRFERILAYLPMVFPETCEQRRQALLTQRVQLIYRNSIELCCAGQATKENRIVIENLISEIQLPLTADSKTKRKYFSIKNRAWWMVFLNAWLRMCYLWIMGI